jgi:phospholipid-binding lipoprotein MlaA
MKEPTLFFNNVLQREFEQAGITLGRFAANTTLGLGGLLDVATDWGLKRQPADFGQTLFTWGFDSGPYLILPLLGPSNPRDAIGMGIDSYSDPFTILATTHGLEELTNARLVSGGIDQRAGAIDTLDELKKNSLDFYAQLRSLAQQNRAAELRRGAAPDPGADFYLDPSAPAAGPAKPAAPPAPAPAPAAGNKAGKARAAAHPIRKAAVRCSIMRTRPSAPARCNTATNSERRVASSLIVPLR